MCLLQVLLVQKQMSERVTALARHDFPERPHQNAHLDCQVSTVLQYVMALDCQYGGLTDIPTRSQNEASPFFDKSFCKKKKITLQSRDIKAQLSNISELI